MSKTETVIMDGEVLFSGVHKRIREYGQPDGTRLYRCEVPLDQDGAWDVWSGADYTRDPMFKVPMSNVSSQDNAITPQALEEMIEELQRREHEMVMDALNRRVLNVGGA